MLSTSALSCGSKDEFGLIFADDFLISVYGMP